MHTGPVPGEYRKGWKPTKTENPNFVCINCGENNVWYRKWESSCGGYEDTCYDCRSCKHLWWVESADT